MNKEPLDTNSTSGNNKRMSVMRFFATNKIAIVIAAISSLVILGGVTAVILVSSEDRPDQKIVEELTEEEIEQAVRDFVADDTTGDFQPSTNEQAIQIAFDENVKTIQELGDDVDIGTITEAAFNAARLDDPRAPTFAQQALDKIPQDEETQDVYAGLIENLKKVAAGDYSGVPQ